MHHAQGVNRVAGSLNLAGQDRDIFDDDYDENDAPGPGSYYNSAALSSFK